MRYFQATHPTFGFDIVIGFDSDMRVCSVRDEQDKSDVEFDENLRHQLEQLVDEYLSD